jgi:excisionase family DNA binding protein
MSDSSDSPAAGPTPIQWMGTHEAARYLGITPRTLYRFINDGALPAFKMGRVIRLRQSDLDDFIESTRIPPGSLEHLTPELRSSGE